MNKRYADVSSNTSRNKVGAGFTRLNGLPAMQVARHEWVRPVVSVFTLTIFLLVQWLPGLALLNAGNRAQAQEQANVPKGTQRSKQVTVRPSAALRSVRQVSMQALDLTRAPGEDELRAAGQHRGALSPTSSADERVWRARGDNGIMLVQQRQANLVFGQAVQAWNEGEFKRAVVLLRRHQTLFPASPWGAEASLYIAEEAASNGRATEARIIYRQLLASTGGAPDSDSYELHQKTKQAWTALEIDAGDYLEAQANLSDILKTEQDWQRITWARHWSRRSRCIRRTRATCAPAALRRWALCWRVWAGTRLHGP